MVSDAMEQTVYSGTLESFYEVLWLIQCHVN